MTPQRAWVAWSSGKDSALALHDALDDPSLAVVGLPTTPDEAPAAVTMHDVPRALVEAQAEALGLPLHVVEVPQPCPDGEYQRRMGAALDAARADGVTVVVFGDLHLADVRAYREEAMTGSGIDPVFPLWDEPVDRVAGRIVDLGLAPVVTCVDTEQLDARFVGRPYDRALLADLPAGVDPCGENGEPHTFVTDGPAFARPVRVAVGDPVIVGRFARVALTPA